MKDFFDRVLKFTLPVNLIPTEDRLCLIAGEDLRYSFVAPGISNWGVKLVQSIVGTKNVAQILNDIAKAHFDDAATIVKNLYSERLLIDVSAEELSRSSSWCHSVIGTGDLYQQLVSMLANDPTAAESRMNIFCQNSLNYKAALDFNALQLCSKEPFLWVTTGPAQRAYISPLFWPDTGPCIGCLLKHFEALSPTPWIYPLLDQHLTAGNTVVANELSKEATAVIANLTSWKVSLINKIDPKPAALYRLHVLEIDTFTISSHVVARNPGCKECAELR